MSRDIKHGDIYYVNLEQKGHLQGGVRPCVIISNDVGNKYSDIVIVIPLTTRIDKKKNMPTHIHIDPSHLNGLKHTSVALAEQIMTVEQTSLLTKIGSIDLDVRQRLNQSIITSICLA